MRKEHAPPFFAPISGPARNGKQFECGHTRNFCRAEGPAKMLVGGRSPNPLDFFQSVKVKDLLELRYHTPDVFGSKPAVRLHSHDRHCYSTAGRARPPVLDRSS